MATEFVSAVYLLTHLAEIFRWVFESRSVIMRCDRVGFLSAFGCAGKLSIPSSATIIQSSLSLYSHCNIHLYLFPYQLLLHGLVPSARWLYSEHRIAISIPISSQTSQLKFFSSAFLNNAFLPRGGALPVPSPLHKVNKSCSENDSTLYVYKYRSVVSIHLRDCNESHARSRRAGILRRYERLLYTSWNRFNAIFELKLGKSFVREKSNASWWLFLLQSWGKGVHCSLYRTKFDIAQSSLRLISNFTPVSNQFYVALFPPQHNYYSKTTHTIPCISHLPQLPFLSAPPGDPVRPLEWRPNVDHMMGTPLVPNMIGPRKLAEPASGVCESAGR